MCRTHVIPHRFGHKAWRRSLEGKPNSCLLETLFVRVWRCRSSFDTPKALRFGANPFINWVYNGRVGEKDSREELCPAGAMVQAPSLESPQSVPSSAPNGRSSVASLPSERCVRKRSYKCPNRDSGRRCWPKQRVSTSNTHGIELRDLLWVASVVRACCLPDRRHPLIVPQQPSGSSPA